MGEQVVSILQILSSTQTDTDENPSDEHAIHCLNKGCQQALTVFVALAVNSLHRLDVALSGVTSQIRSALTQPTLGGLHALLIQCYNNGAFLELQDVQALWAEERRNAGPLGQLVQARNQLEHPRGMTRSAILDQARAILSNLPPILQDPRIALDGHNRMYWLEANQRHDLWPLITCFRDGIVQSGAYTPTGRFEYSEYVSGAESAWSDLWKGLRHRDRALDAPSWQEFCDRANRSAVEVPASVVPWWGGKIWDGQASALLVEPAPKSGHGWNLNESGKAAAVVHLVMEKGETVSEALSRELGFLEPMSQADLKNLVPIDEAILLGVDARDLDHQDILRHLYWIADLHELACQDCIRIALVIEVQQLDQVWQRHWDRLPDTVDRLLLRPPRSRSGDLRGYLWPVQRPRLFLGRW